MEDFINTIKSKAAITISLCMIIFLSIIGACAYSVIMFLDKSPYFSDQDRCLDNGKRWDDEKNECVGYPKQ